MSDTQVQAAAAVLYARKWCDTPLSADELEDLRAAMDAAERAAWRPIAALEDIDSLIMIADEKGMLMGLYMPHRQPEGAAWWREVTVPTALLSPAPDGEARDG